MILLKSHRSRPRKSLLDCQEHFAYLSISTISPEERLPRVRILFTSTLETSFIKEDLRLLRQHFAVDHIITGGFRAPLQILRHLFHADVTFTWFASVYAFVVVILAKLTRKKSIVVIGGVDASKFPEIRYGIWLSPWRAVLVKWTMRHAHRILAVDPSLKKEAARLASYDGKNIFTVPTGYDPSVWFPLGPKEPFVLTVAACEDEWRLKKKGIDVLFEAARLLPDTEFIIIGILHRLLQRTRQLAPQNVGIVPFAEQREILFQYQKAKVYCQPSFTEGLPNSLCEAMLCECVPVGTAVGGIPTAIDETGFLVPYGDPARLAEAITAALASPAKAGKPCRERIATMFPLRKREEELVRIVGSAAR